MSFRVGPKHETRYVASTDGWACVVAERMARKYPGVPIQVRRVSDGALLGCWFREEPEIADRIALAIHSDHMRTKADPAMREIYGEVA